MRKPAQPVRGAGRRRLTLARLVAAGAALCYSLAVAQTGEAPPERAVVEQKLKLLESVLNSPKLAQAASSSDPETAALAAKARQGLEQARAALDANDTLKSAALLDQALRASSAASLKASRSAAPPPEVAQRNRNNELMQEVSSYRTAIAEALKTKNSAKGAAALQRIDGLVAEANGLTAANHHADAGKAITQAYGISVATISELRAGETVTHELKFETPADEYAYEQKRHQSNEMLVDMMIKEGKVDAGRKQLLDRYLEDSFRLRSEAEKLAKSGDYPGAIKNMEKANDQIMNALRATGLAGF